MPYTVNTSEVFDDWFSDLEEALQDSVTASVDVFQQYGPQLVRPHVDTLKGSSLKNLKELRVQHGGDPYRILIAFDPKREALLLLGGNKASDKRWYEKMIPQAEALFRQHLETLDKEN